MSAIIDEWEVSQHKLSHHPPSAHSVCHFRRTGTAGTGLTSQFDMDWATAIILSHYTVRQHSPQVTWQMTAAWCTHNCMNQLASGAKSFTTFCAQQMSRHLFSKAHLSKVHVSWSEHSVGIYEHKMSVEKITAALSDASFDTSSPLLSKKTEACDDECDRLDMWVSLVDWVLYCFTDQSLSGVAILLYCLMLIIVLFSCLIIAEQRLWVKRRRVNYEGNCINLSSLFQIM